ncbi:MAG: alpha/beta fold hydrolase, partial [Phycisphaerales bacterium]|nr:alpha/beta fold hydrolase [Phycisphaerales bacterium]
IDVARQVVLWELPGHGEAGGVCSLGARESTQLRAVLEAIPGDARIVLYGFSLGAGVSIAAAAELGPSRVSGVIAEAPYRVPATPARNVLRLRGLPYRSTLGPALLLARRKAGRELTPGVFDRVAWAARMPESVPLLVLHGDADAVCPLEDARAIASAAPAGRLVVVASGDHQGLWSTPSTREARLAAVREFVDSLSPTPGAASEAEPATRSS